jgi:hypothetical protein
VAAPPQVLAPGAASATSASGFPSVTVTDITSGKGVNLSTLATTKTPVLFWMWAPS